MSLLDEIRYAQVRAGEQAVIDNLRRRGLLDKETEKVMAEAVDSTSDERTVNNIMRHQYRVLSDEEKAQMQSIKDKGLEFVELCQKIGSSRELSIAITKTEEAVMWAVKHITR